MRDAFKLFDTDGDGTVTAKELKHVMDTLFHMNLSDEELDEMVKDVDQNGDGEVSFDGTWNATPSFLPPHVAAAFC